MKLKYIEEYKSIGLDIKSCLESLDFPDFSIITGTNGSGKTHLLEAILGKHVRVSVEDIEDYGPITYFNYQNFVLDYLSDKQKINPIQKATGDNEFMSIANQLLQTNQLVENPQFAKAMREYIYNSVLDNKEISLKDLKEKYTFRVLTELSEKEFKQLINNVQNFVKDFCKKRTVKDLEKLKDFIVEGIPLVSEYSESYLGQSLFNNVKNYFRNRARAKVDTPEGEAFDTKKYEEKHGINPLALFNQVLRSFSCNGYLFNENFPLSSSQLLQMDDSEFYNFYYKTFLIKENDSVSIDIESLSSGEKTLLALASIIHKHIQKSQNDFISGVLLLDEIDTNLHHSMLNSMLKAIDDIFRKKYMMKIIMVTHSPTTVALAPDDSLFVMDVKNNTNERIRKTTKAEALNTLTEGYATLESGIMLINLEKELVILTEGHNVAFIEKAIDFFAKDFKEKIDIIEKFIKTSGRNQLETYFNFLSKLPLKNKFLFVFDCDVDISKFKNTDKVIAFKFDKKKSRISKGIENLFPEKLFGKEFYNEGKKHDGGIYTELNKNKFRNHMLHSGKEEDFLNFKPLIDEMKSLLDNPS